MDFKKLKYLLAIAEYENISKASKAMNITQPSMSKFLQNTESELGIKLFNKEGNKFILSQAGKIYVDKSKEIMKIKSQLDNEIADLSSTSKATLNIGYPIMRGTYLPPCTFPDFHKIYPQVKINIIEASSSKLEDMIIDGEIDLAFFNLPVKNKEIAYEVIANEELLLSMSPDNPLSNLGKENKHSKYPKIDLELLKDAEFIVPNPEHRTGVAVHKLFKKCSYKPNISMDIPNPAAALRLASLNYGIYFIDEAHIKHIGLEKPIKFFSVGSPKTTIDFVAAYRKNVYMPKFAKKYIEIVKEFSK